MKAYQLSLFSLFIIWSFALLPVFAEDTESTLTKIQHDWAYAKYKSSGKDQKERFMQLIEESEKFIASSPDSAEALIWGGIVQSTYAGVKGGIGALKYAKNARKKLEQAIKLDPSALQGSAYTSLGTLYYKVPGFPLGFGNKRKAEELLLKALEINPNGIDSNYFYGDYLIEQKQYAKAIPVLEKALAAPDRPDRLIADEGRRQEIKNALAVAKSKA